MQEVGTMAQDIEIDLPAVRHFGGDVGDDSPVDICELRTEVQAKYAAVAERPHDEYHFHTGRYVAQRCGYDMQAVDALPEAAIESFAGVGNPFELRALRPGEKVVDLGSGAGTDSFLAAGWVGDSGQVVGIDMTTEMLDKARSTAAAMGAANVEFREGYLEEVPVEDGWADVVISNGVINLSLRKRCVFEEMWRVLRPGGRISICDIVSARAMPSSIVEDPNLWAS
jgi:arsenite methyltransferase